MSRFCFRFLWLCALCASFGFGSRVFAQTPAPTPTGSTFVPVSGFFDFAPDTSRGLIYFSRSTQVLRWRKSDQTWLAPVEVGGNLRALDVSPDGTTLAVADAQPSTLGTPGTFSSRVALVDLNTLAVRNILFSPRSGESGTYSLAFDSAGNLLIAPGINASQFSGGAFRLWNAATNQTSTLWARTPTGGINDASIASNTAIVADTSRACLSFVEINSSTGNWGFYSSSTGALTRFLFGSGTSGGNYPGDTPFGVASDSGSRFYLPTAGALQVRSASGSFVGRYNATNSSLGLNSSVALDSTRSLLYVTPSSSSKIEIRDPVSFASRGFLNAGKTWSQNPASSNNSLPYGISQLRAASDGTLLIVRVIDGVRVFALENGLPASPLVVTNALNTPEDVPVAFTLDSPSFPGAAPPYDIARRPLHGTLTGIGPNYTYSPALNYNGPDSFAIAVHSNVNTSYTIQEVAVTVSPVNDAPVAIAASTSNHIGETRRVAVYFRDIDLGQDVFSDPNFTYEIVTPPAHGTLVRYPATRFPIYDYTPQPGYAGDDSFTFRGFDGQAYSNTATFSIKNIGPIPVGRDDVFSSALASSVTIPAPGVLSNDTQSTISYLSAPSNVSNGSVVFNANGSFTWTASASGPPASGVVTFQYRLSDGFYLGSAPLATVTLQLVAPLVAQNQSLSTTEDTALEITLSATGATNTTFAITKLPTHGTLSGTAPDLIYTPALNWNGSDSFEFSATDGTRTSTGTVSLTVSPVNDAPLAYGYDDMGFEDSPSRFTLGATDVDGDTLSFVITSQPAHGTLTATANGGEFVFTPEPNFDGGTSFTWKVSDGTLDSNEITTSLGFLPLNDAPVAQSQSLALEEDVPTSVVLGASDVDSTNLSFAITTNPAHGQLSGTAPNLLYTPDANWSGSDSFAFTAKDASLSSPPATVSITVNAANDAPVAASQTVSGDEDANISVTLNATDAEGDTLSFAITTQPSHGTLKHNGSAVVYRAFDDWNGTDSFGFTASDGQSTSDEATVTVVVRAVSDVPVARTDDFEAVEDVTLTVVSPGALGNDASVDGKTLRAVLKSQPANGSVVLNADGSFVYTPDANWNGSDSFSYAASDGTLESAPVTVSLAVSAVNDAPIARADEQSGREDAALLIKSSDLLANDFDADGDALAIASVSAPAHGTLVAQNGGFLYTPDANWSGDDEFSYTLANGPTAQVSLHIAPVNDVPVADAQSVSLDEDTSKAIVVSATDVDGDALSFTVATQPTNGTLSGTAPNLTYSPRANWSGTDSFTFSASDSSGAKSSATVSLVISPINDAPVASPISLSTNANTAKSFSATGSASDVDGDALTFVVKTAPANGTLSSQGSGNFVYTPRTGFVGSDAFSISATDASGASATIAVSISVVSTQPNRAPSTQGSNFVLLEDGALTFNLVAFDQDGDALTYSVVQQPQQGNVTANGGASFRFTPPANYFGSQTFTFQVRDARGATSNTSTVQLQTSAVNDAPTYDLAATSLTVAKNSNAFGQNGFARNLNVGGLPFEQGQVLTFSLQTSNTSLFDQQPGISSNGTLTFRPRSGRTGTATVTINARDNGGTSNGGKDSAPVKTFTITIR